MANAVNSVWTEERIDELRRLWAAGYSCSQIATAMGDVVTRNAVIGKVHRLHLPGRDQNIFNANGATRFVDPTPADTPRASPKYRRPQSVFKMRERKPRNKVVNPNEKPAITTAFSTLTGQFTGAVILRRPGVGELTKNELRAMLTQAVQNTAAMT